MALVTIKKTGQPTLRILPVALEQHVKLGWRHVEDEPIKDDALDAPKKEETIKLKTTGAKL